jgi:hypothetical protein
VGASDVGPWTDCGTLTETGKPDPERVQFFDQRDEMVEISWPVRLEFPILSLNLGLR